MNIVLSDYFLCVNEGGRMKTIHCPKDIGFVNTFDGEDCERERFYNDCYHCWASAIAVALQKKREIGKWIHRNDDYNDWLECSRCGYGSEGEVKYGENMNYCPNCGLKMEEVKHDER